MEIVVVQAFFFDAGRRFWVIHRAWQGGKCEHTLRQDVLTLS